MKRVLLSLFALIGIVAVSVKADTVWKAGDALITNASQITSTPPQSSQFGVENLLRPESDGFGTNQYIFHTAWSGSNMIPAGTDPYLQFHFNEPEQHIIFSMIGSAWVSTYDTPTMVVIQATNDPIDGWTTITTLEDMDVDFTSYNPERYTSPHIDLGAEYSYVKFLVKKTYANRRADGTANTGLLLSLGRFQIYEAYEDEVDPTPGPVGPVWKKDVALLTDASQISSNNVEDGFPPSNLLRPESDGFATGQYIWHTSWSNPAPANTDTYLQTHFNIAVQDIIFTMTSSEWVSTYDTPDEVVIMATNTPDVETSWQAVAHLEDMIEIKGAHPTYYTSPHVDLGAQYTDLRFVVKKTTTIASSARHDANGNPYVSLGRFQVYSAVEGEPDPIDPKSTINLLFIGNSITYGATLGNPVTQAPPIVCRSLVADATGLEVNVYNGGHSGITTLGFLPGRDDFTRVVNAAKKFIKDNGGSTYFSIMLGTNDSACNGTEGAPVANNVYAANIRKIIDALIKAVPDCKIVLNYPIWYSPNTYNGAMYLRQGMERLHGYYPLIDAIVEEYDQVYAGNRQVWEFFEDNKVLFTAEAGNAGTFFLHPNAEGAKRLAEIWAKSLLELIEADGIEIKNPLPEWNIFTPQPDKAYYISTPRGNYGTKGGFLTNTVRTDLGATKGQFAFVTRDTLTYLYSVTDKQFMYRDPVPYREDWSNVILTTTMPEPVKVHYAGINKAYPYCLTSEGYVFNTSSDTQQGVCLNTYTDGSNAGNQTTITEAGTFDPTEALAMLDDYFNNQTQVQYRIVDTEGNLLETQTAIGMAGQQITAVPPTLVRKGYTTYELQEPVTITKDGDNVVTFTATWKLPFEVSPDLRNAHWYNLALRNGNDFVTSDNSYKCNLNPTKEQLNSLSYQWAFQGNPFDGIVVYNRTSQIKSLAKVSDRATLRYGVPYKWQIVESADGFLLATPDDSNKPYINEYGGAGGPLGFWSNISDVGSIFRVYEVGSRLSVNLPSGASLKLIRSDNDKANGCGVLIIPGGGYEVVAGDYEGASWAPIFNDLGYTVGVLKYTVPPTAPDGPMTQALEAMQYLRDNGAEWNIANGEIGVMGFSAGGHLASTVATHTSGTECPAFQVLFYPVITMDASYTHSGSRQNLLGSNPSNDLVNLYSNEKQVSGQTPPAFICWADNDGAVPPANSINYAAALKKSGVAVHTKNVPTGGHGFGYNTSFKYHQEIVDDLIDWLTDIGETLTAVNSIPRASAINAPVYYNLYGQRVSEPHQGIYITEGKKIRVN